MFLDVGQGDGVFMRTASGTTYLIDCGSSDNKSLYEYTLEPFLLSEGISFVDYIIVTHCDSDHISGIEDLLETEKIDVGTLVLPYLQETDERYDNLIEIGKRSGAEIEFIYSGISICDGETRLSCLHPDKNYHSNDKNVMSTSLLVEYGDFSMLLTGDISESEEKIILESGKLKENITVYKAAHHGSKYSNSMELLNYINPVYTVISYGEDNSYGHPHKEVNERLEEIGTKVFYTAKSGAVSIKIDSSRLWIDSVK